MPHSLASSFLLPFPPPLTFPLPCPQVAGSTTLRVMGLERTLRDQHKATSRYKRLAANEARRKKGGAGGEARSPAHLGRLVRVDPVDVSRLTPVQAKAALRNAQVGPDPHALRPAPCRELNVRLLWRLLAGERAPLPPPQPPREAQPQDGQPALPPPLDPDPRGALGGKETGR